MKVKIRKKRNDPKTAERAQDIEKLSEDYANR